MLTALKIHWRAACLFLLFLLAIGTGSVYRSGALDNTVALLLVAWCVAGSVAIVVRHVRHRPGDPQRFGGPQFPLLPEKWRRWMLDEEMPKRR